MRLDLKEILRVLAFFVAVTCACVGTGYAQHDDSAAKQPWKAQTTFDFPLGGNSIGLGGSSFGDQAAGSIGMVEQVSLTCVAPSDVLVQNVNLELFEDDKAYRYELQFRERPTAPNGSKTIVVSQTVSIRVRFGFGGFGIGLNVWNGPANSSMHCTATLSGYTMSPKS
jgi:hypothetical protein